MAASLALAGSGCNSSTQFGAPLLSRPVARNAWAEGQPVQYATSLTLDGIGRGVLVETIDARPVKIEGNPQHPASLGATDAFMQAELLSLYCPERSRVPQEGGQPRTWSHANAMLTGLVRDVSRRQGRGLHFLTGPIGSPTLLRLIGELRSQLPAARVHTHAPIDDDNARTGTRIAFGRDLTTVHDFGLADTIVSLGADFLGHGPLQVRNAAGFAARRARGRETGHMPRLIAAQVTPGLTGARADERLALAPHEIERLAMSIASELGILPGNGGDSIDARAVAIAAALKTSGPASVVLAGPDQSASVHAIAHAINASLGAVGRTVRYLEPTLPSPAFETLGELIAAIAAGDVEHLVVMESNPAYTGPADLAVAEHIARVPLSVHLGYDVDETARVCKWHLPQRHVLESWGDTVTFDGTAALQQPAVAPQVEAITPIELLALLRGASRSGVDAVQDTWRMRWDSEFELRWLAALEAGVVSGSTAAAAPAAVRPWEDWAAAVAREPTPPTGLSVHFAADPSMWDGRYGGNAWLQELPKPLTKQVWGNAARIGTETAAHLKVADGDIVVISTGSGSLEAPVQVVPGQARETITLPLGYGRTLAGAVGSHVGFDAYRLRSSTSPWVLPGARLARSGRSRRLITTQHHHGMEGRDIVRIVVAGAPASAAAPAPVPHASLYPEHTHTGHAWGMTIDLDACIGCNACVVACQAENNVPVVGPEEVAAGREMHWLRVDRYHAAGSNSAETYFQPVPCMHCEEAPCEVVCPVNATVHSSEGLNDMVYNRCIGTRTCSNNCPYKVRRFNWFAYAAVPPGATGADLNPEVTVRPRGVMEKCTYCTQRISASRISARIERRPLRDGEILTACQQACPTNAIVFGDIADPESAISRQKRDPRNYALLGELNTKPRTTYLARIAARASNRGD